ncbi:hypothetical protein DR62_06615 [Burkholderia thailandensis]|nr:hypothetical protein DR62_06615 [Burkholderia thailandensis]AOI52155.1 hypothetical protein WI24_10315 [Burkholderia thailandensis]
MSARDAAVAPHRAEAGRAACSAGGHGRRVFFRTSAAHPPRFSPDVCRTFAGRIAERLPNTR